MFTRAGTKTSTHYLEASALSASNIQTGFTVSLVDTSQSKLELFSFGWVDPLYQRLGETTIDFVRKQRAIANTFLRSSEFEKTLEEVTTPFLHPRKELRLSDIYVPPPVVNVIPESDGQTTEQHIPAEGVIDFVLSSQVIRICAPTGYGKSALARALCRDALDLRGVVAVFLTADAVNGSDVDRVTRSVEKQFSKQYSPDILENYRQLDHSSKILIFDEWERLRFNDNGRRQLLNSLAALATHVVILDDSSPFQHRLTDLTTSPGAQITSICEIRQFGYQLRGSLIEKWHRLGRAFDVGEEVLTHEISVSEHLLNGLIGRGITPSTPLFILSALQMQREAMRAGSDYGSYGHIYQALITSRLAQRSETPVPLKINFLAALAFIMFEEQSDSLSATQIRQAADNYRQEYGYDFDANALLTEIAGGGLILFDGETLRFEYRYVYYYSVAYAFRGRVADENVRNGVRAHLTRLAAEAYFEDNANILIFYLYLSKDRVLIEEVLANSQRIFATISPCDLDSNLAFINELFGTKQAVIENPSEDLSQNRSEIRSAQDEAASRNDASQRTAEIENSSVSEVNFAMRSLEIMGQVLKNFPTDLRRDLKASLIKESYALALRTIGSFLHSLQLNRKPIREALSLNLARESAFASRSLEKQEAAVKAVVFLFAEIGIYGILKKLSTALGTEELRHSYDDARADLGEDRISTRLIDLAIRLDHFAGIPEKDIFDLEKKLRSNAAGLTVFKMLVAEHIAFFPTHWRLRQRLVSTFNLSRTTGLPSPKQILPNK